MLKSNHTPLYRNEYLLFKLQHINNDTETTYSQMGHNFLIVSKWLPIFHQINNCFANFTGLVSRL